MREKMAKILHLLSAPNRLERACSLAEIRLNHLLFKHDTPSIDVITFDQFLAQLHLNDAILFDIMKSGGEAGEAVQWNRSKLNNLVKERINLPFPTFYNPDQSFAL